MKRLLVFLLALTLLMVSTDCYASDVNAVRKLTRGIANAAGCWIELIRQPILVNREEGDLAGATGCSQGVGFALGVGLGVYG